MLYHIKKIPGTMHSKHIYEYVSKKQIASKMYSCAHNFNLLALIKSKEHSELSNKEHKLFIEPIYDKNKIGVFKSLYNTLMIEKTVPIGINIMLEEMNESQILCYWKNVLEPTIGKSVSTKAVKTWKEKFLFDHLKSIKERKCFADALCSDNTITSIIEIISQQGPYQQFIMNLMVNSAEKGAYCIISSYFGSTKGLAVKKFGRLYSTLAKHLDKDEIEKYIRVFVDLMENSTACLLYTSPSPRDS